jgi:hypothetical protein|nr:MAG TPA: hypothetical protein [Crassvirales sp.]
MEDTFYITAEDKGLSIVFKREANIILASLDKNSNEYKFKYNKFEEVLRVIKAIEYTEPQHDKDVDFILDTINKIWNIGILSPLTLKNDEFNDYNTNGCYKNKRYPYIYHCGNGKIYNDNAYKLYIRAVYDATINSQIDFTPTICYPSPFNKSIFISKGGIITGEYVQQCEIRKDIVERHSFNIQSVVNIPVARIIDGDSVIHVVDHREPKLKVLREFYEVPIYIDETVKNKHYNLRKYIKLNK